MAEHSKTNFINLSKVFHLLSHVIVLFDGFVPITVTLMIIQSTK